MSNQSRRDILKLLGASALSASGILGYSKPAFAAKKANILIIGGGIGGITTAKYLRLLNNDVNITVIEPNSKYTFCPGSNEVLVGEPIENFIRTYDHTRARYNFNIIADKASAIDFDNKQVKTEGGNVLKYDSLVIAPGPTFSFDDIEGYSLQLAESKILHAWKAGRQTTMLRDQVHAMRQGGTMVIATPAMPFRCPPAPYERASFLAGWMEEHNPRGKIIILDKNPGFIFQTQYTKYWKEHFGFGTDKARIERITSQDGGGIASVDANNMTVTDVHGDTIKADVINIIPTNLPHKLATDSGLTKVDFGIKVNHHDMSIDGLQDVYLIGDSADFLVKTGYLASNQGKVVAAAIDDRLHGVDPRQPIYTNNCVAKASLDDFGMSIADTFRERNGELLLAQTVQDPLPDVIDNPFLHHIRAKVSDNWQRSFRRAVFD
jgi:sulfide dehydrogenase [flavocytochrome c] flavoprotein subunit